MGGDTPSARRGMFTWLALAVLVVGCVTLFLWIGSPSTRNTAPLEPFAGDADSVTPIAAPPPPNASDSQRTSIELLEAQAPPVAATPALVEDPNELRGRVVDPAGLPLAGARVLLRRGDLRGFTVLDLEVGLATEPIGELSTPSSGEFRFELARGVPVDLHVEAQDYCPALLPNRHAGEFVVVSMNAGSTVHGRVTRERNGSPVADARVRVFRMGGPASLVRETRTAGDGTYELRFPFREGAVLEIVPQVEQCPAMIELQLDATGRVEKNVAVQDGFRVEGRVTAADTGLPISGATVGEGWVFRRTAVTNAQGDYVLRGFGDPAVTELFAKARGFGQAKRQDLPGAKDGVLRVDFRLAPARSARGRVVDPSGAALPGVLAAAIASEFGPQGQRTDWISSRTDASGRFAIESLSPDLSHALLLSKPGFATLVYDFPRGEHATPELDLGTFVLDRPGLIAGSVVDETGALQTDTEVAAKGHNGDRFRFQDVDHTDGGGIGDWYTDSRRTRTDSQGRYSFGDLPAGDYSLLARRRGRPPGESVHVTLAQGESQDQVKLVLPSGSGLRGRVIDPEGKPVAAIYLSAYVVELRQPGPDQGGSTRADSEGRFEITGLKPGVYQLVVHAPPPEADRADAPLLRTVVERVSTDSGDLTIELLRGATIRGTLHDAEGAFVFGYPIFVRSERDDGAFDFTNANGEFCLQVPSGSLYDLEVRGTRAHRNWDKILLVEPAVAAGTRGLKLTLP